MDSSDGTAAGAESLKSARARLANAEASVIAAKKDFKASKAKRKEAKEAERRAKKCLRRAKKELREAKRLLASIEDTPSRPATPRRLKPIAAVKADIVPAVPRPAVRGKKTRRKRAIPALKPKRPRRSSNVASPVATDSEPITVPPAIQSPTVTPPELAPPVANP